MPQPQQPQQPPPQAPRIPQSQQPLMPQLRLLHPRSTQQRVPESPSLRKSVGCDGWPRQAPSPGAPAAGRHGLAPTGRGKGIAPGPDVQCAAHVRAAPVQCCNRQQETPLQPRALKQGGGGLVDTAAPQQQRFPSTGKPMVIKMVCSHLDMSAPMRISEVEGHQVTSDWTLDHLLQASEMVTGVNRASQKLFHAGKEMALGSTIRDAIGLEEKDLPEWCTVHMLVDEDRFPRRLDPFGLTAVPLKADDFILPTTSTRYGFHWIMLNEVVERLGVRSTGDNQVTAQCSPPTPITLSEEERASLGIPAEAVDFVWSYPVANWDKVDQDPHLLENWDTAGTINAAVKDFLAVGGFMYLDNHRRLVHVAASLCNTARTGGLQFSSPRKWNPAWTSAILEDGRFHRVTIGPLREAGAHYFCWLLPGETFMDDNGRLIELQPEVPLGGFAYVFHELSATSAQDLAVDCYFAVDAVSGIAPTDCESFALLGEERPSELLGHTSAQLNHHSICCIPEA